MANKLRVVNFNIHGAKAPGRKSRTVLERSWHLLAAYGADLALVQEVEIKAIPEWARRRWTIIHGDKATYGDDWPGWGSVIAADPSLKLHSRLDLLEHRLTRLIYDYAMFGEVVLPDGAPALVFSVHAPARKLDDYLKIMGRTGALNPDESDAMAQQGDKPWALDLFFAAIESVVKGQRFLVGGDWNNSRLFDLDPQLRKRGQSPFSTMFFTRAFDAGWRECHGDKNEERSYLKANSLPYQLDHLFCDQKTFKQRVNCRVRADWIVHELSDHAPLVTDFNWP
jgi:endonuclease/exonuclease/phosphatase family metal-dependent hydrolase